VGLGRNVRSRGRGRVRGEGIAFIVIERDCFYYIIIQTYEVGLHSRSGEGIAFIVIPV